MLNGIQQISSCIGYGEYYEWEKNFVKQGEDAKLGYFISFSKEEKNKICKCTDPSKVIGVSSFSSCCLSDLPEFWPNKYIKNEYGRAIIVNENVGAGKLEYDEELDLEYISTSKKTIITPVINPDFDNKRDYIRRNGRIEWQNVTILGKCIVQDYGECEPGDYCTIYKGIEEDRIGTAMKAKDNDINKYYVIDRISEKTILILFK